jgi:hypothetical protein
MRKRQKTEIKLEIEESLAIRSQRILMAYCRRCRRQMRMIAANEAAMIAGLSAREIYRFVEDGQLHFIEDHNGLLFVCIASLDQLGSENRR